MSISPCFRSPGVSFRLGYSHNNMTGPSYSSIHEGTEGLLLQPWNTTMNSYRMGVDLESRRELSSATTNSSITTRETRTTQLAPFAPALLPAAGSSGVSWVCPSTLRTRSPAR